MSALRLPVPGEVLRWFDVTADRIEQVLRNKPAEDFLVLFAFYNVKPLPEGAPKPEPLPKLSGVTFQRSRAEVVAALRERQCQVESNDDWSKAIEPRTEREKEGFAENYAIAEPIIRDGESHLFPDKRGPLVKKVIEERTAKGKKISKAKVYRVLRPLWRTGMNINSLTPGYRRRGGAGQPKLFVKQAPVTGTNKKPRFLTTLEDRANIAFALKKVWLTRAEPTLSDTHVFLISKFYTKNGRILERHPPYDLLRHYKDKIPLHIQLQFRKGVRAFNKDYRAVLGSAKSNSTAPGEKCEFDAVDLPVYCVCEVNRALVIGQPIMHLIAECLVGAPAGFSLSLDPPSCVGVGLAIENSIRNKDEYLRSIGVKAQRGAWPYEGVAELYTGDGGEGDSTYAEAISRGLVSHVEIITGYRPDWKGMVEFLILMISRRCRRLEGWKKKRIRGEEDAKLRACLTLREVERIVARCIVTLWKRLRPVQCLDRSMMEAGLIATPLEMWTHLVEERGRPRVIAKDIVRLNLLKRDVARVTSHGFKFGKLFYTCPRAEKEQWFVKARFGGWDVAIAHHPKIVDEIFLISDGQTTTVEACKLTGVSVDFAGATRADVDAFLRDYDDRLGPYKLGFLQERVTEELETQAIRKAARSAQRKALSKSPMSKFKRKKNVKQNRAQAAKRLNTERFGKPQPTPPETSAAPATTPPPPNATPKTTDYTPGVDNSPVLDDLLPRVDEEPPKPEETPDDAG